MLAPLLEGNGSPSAARICRSWCVRRVPSGGPKRTVLRSARTFHVPRRTGWLLAWEHAIDIDTDDDWRLAEALLRDGVGRRAAT